MLNSCEFIGNLGKDPEIRYTQQSTAVANISIAVTEKWRDKNSGEQREKTEWINVVLWDKLAEIAEKYLHKGSKVFVRGKFQTRKWQDKDGNDRWSTEISLQGFDAKLEMLDPPRNDGDGDRRQDDRRGGSRRSNNDQQGSGGYDDNRGGGGRNNQNDRGPGYGGNRGSGGSGGGGGYDRRDMDDEIPF